MGQSQQALRDSRNFYSVAKCAFLGNFLLFNFNFDITFHSQWFSYCSFHRAHGALIRKLNFHEISNLLTLMKQINLVCVFHPGLLSYWSFHKVFWFVNQNSMYFRICQLSYWNFFEAFGTFIRIRLQHYCILMRKNSCVEC